MSSNVILTNQQNEILEKVKTGRNLFITGGAGTGKSFIVEHILKELKSCGRQTLVTASTGIAATLIKGVTCHRAFRIPKKITLGSDQTVSNRSPIYAADAVIIDEVSMLRIDAFEYIVNCIEIVNRLRKSGIIANKAEVPIQVILIGDFFQLPPYFKRKKGGLTWRMVEKLRTGDLSFKPL